MIEKNEFCKYCGKELKSKTAKKIFCNDKCRIYYGRELKRGTLNVPKIITEKKQLNNLTTELSKVLNDDERNDIEKQIKDWQTKKRFGFMGAAEFDKMREKEISELKSKLI